MSRRSKARARKRLARWWQRGPLVRVRLPDGSERDLRSPRGLRQLALRVPLSIAMMYDQSGHGRHATKKNPPTRARGERAG